MFDETDVTTWTPIDYQRLLAEVETLLVAEKGTPEDERLTKLAALIEAYEAIHYPMEPASLEAIIEFRRDNGWRMLLLTICRPIISRC